MGHVHDVGRWGEDRAVEFLMRKGFSIIERNYHTTVGEIDIVAKHGDDWYFIEVKTRQASSLATDLSITPSKKRKLDKTIKRYCYVRSIVDGSLVVAGLIVRVDRQRKTVGFRLAAFC